MKRRMATKLTQARQPERVATERCSSVNVALTHPSEQAVSPSLQVISRVLYITRGKCLSRRTAVCLLRLFEAARAELSKQTKAPRPKAKAEK